MLRRSADYGRFIFFFILVFLLFLMQSVSGLLPRVFGVLPLPVIPAVVCIALFERSSGGEMLGLAGGLFMDIVSMQITGFNALFLMLAGCICSLLAVRLIRNNLLSALTVSAGAVCAYYLLHFLFFYLFKGRSEPFYYFFRYVIPGAAYTTLFSVPLYIIVRLFMKKVKKGTLF